MVLLLHEMSVGIIQLYSSGGSAQARIMKVASLTCLGTQLVGAEELGAGCPLSRWSPYMVAQDSK